jgi:hypothetical protein
LYQLLVGDFAAPVTLDWSEEVKDAELRKELARAFSGQPANRFDRIAQMARNLRALQSGTPAAPVLAACGSITRQAPLAPQSIAQSVAPAGGMIDLGNYHNAELTADWCNRVGCNLAALSRAGHIRVDNKEFEPRGIIQVGCFQSEKLADAYPQKVERILIGRKVRRLHFLQASLNRAPTGAKIGHYVVHYADGCQEVPLIYGEDLRCWLTESDSETELRRGTLAWTGRTTGLFLRSIRLFSLSWKNSRPDDEILSLDFESLSAEGAPFLVALTAS